MVVGRISRRIIAVMALAAPLLSGCSPATAPTSPEEATKQDALTQQGVQNAGKATTAESSQDALTRQGSGGN